MASNATGLAASVRDVIYRSALLLDGGQTPEWLDTHCSVDFHYSVTTYSPEIRREQEWFGGSRDELFELIRLLPRHNSDHAALSRHVSVYAVDVSDDGSSAEATSVVAVYQTLLDGQNSHLDAGSTRLLCTGKYHDRLRLDGDQPVLQRRNLRLDTREWGTGSHVIL
jgi:methanesulfonate monooxygenase small subunit